MGYNWQDGVAEVSRYFSSELNGFEPLAEGTERHGVWEWRAMQQGPPQLRRYVVLTTTNLDRENAFRDAQVHVGVDNERMFTKRVVARSVVAPYELPEFLIQNLRMAAEAVMALTEDDFDMLYGQRRVFPPDQAPAPA